MFEILKFDFGTFYQRRSLIYMSKVESFYNNAKLQDYELDFPKKAQPQDHGIIIILATLL